MFGVPFRMTVVFVMLLIFSACEKSPHSDGSVSGKSMDSRDIVSTKKLAVISDNYLKDKELQQQMHPTLVVSNNGNGYAYIEPVDGMFRVISNGKKGKLYKSVGDITMSADGSRVAYSAAANETFRKIVVNDLEGPAFMEIGMPEFTPDGKHFVYTITQKDETFIAFDHKVFYDYKIAQGPLVAGDSQQLVFSTKPGKDGAQQLVISDYTLNNKQVFESCGETFAASDDLSRLAVVCKEGDSRAVKVIDVKQRKVVASLKRHSGGRISRLTFSTDNRSVAYTFIVNDEERYLVYDGKEVRILAGDEFMSLPIVFAEGNGVGVITGMAIRMGLLNAFADKPHNERNFGYISDFIGSKDGRHHAYLGIELGGETLQRLVVDGNEGRKFDKIVSPLFSPDGRSVAFRARQDGKRFMAVSDLKGNIVKQHQSYDMVFQPVFSADGKSVGYGALVGNELWWKVEKL